MRRLGIILIAAALLAARVPAAAALTLLPFQPLPRAGRGARMGRGLGQCSHPPCSGAACGHARGGRVLHVLFHGLREADRDRLLRTLFRSLGEAAR